MKISAFAPAEPARLPAIDGVRLAAIEAGIKYRGRKDLMLAVLTPKTVAAGVFTRSKTAAAPVLWCQNMLAHAHETGGPARALVVNAGNANAFTGMRGEETVKITTQAAATALNCRPEQVFIASTGVIGEALDPSGFAHFLGGMAETASDDSAAWSDAAAAIMTTDTYPKAVSHSVKIDGIKITINGIAKGSGMIAPDMATMLSFVFTDAPVAQPLLQNLLAEATDKTFNMITVDSDTSTSDTLMVFATGAAAEHGMAEISDPSSDAAQTFASAFQLVLSDLSRMVVMDGEGISKLISVCVTGAEDDKAAKVIAMAIANSPLVKTAMAGEDPNWGRIIMAVGKAGEAADRDKLSIWFGSVEVARNGEVAPSYREEDGAEYMKRSEISLRVDVGIAEGEAVVWTCDLTHDYISINADYRS